MPDLKLLMTAGVLLMGLASLPGTAARPKPTPGADELRGKALFLHYCTGCHGVDGRGDGPVASLLTPRPADLTREQYTYGTEDHDVYKSIEQGRPKTSMAGWSNALQPDQIQDVVFYLQWLRRSAAEKSTP